jgi:hypothetical protein
VSFPTVAGIAVEGTPYREAQSCLGPTFAGSTYQFFLSGTSTPANVYQDGALTTPFPITGFVAADSFGRFPPIYLDTSVIYRVQFYDSTNTLRWTVDPYTPLLSTVGTSALSAFGFQIATTGELTLDAPNTGGSGVTLTLKAGVLGSAALRLIGTIPGNSALIVNSSATTGAQTATFAATNKPGTATSAPAGWLPITCDGVQYYTPIWHGNPFSPYVSSPTAVGEIINANSVNFGGNGVTTATNGSATPGNWFTPASANIGASYYINISKNSGLSGVDYIVDTNTLATVAPSGAAYVGGNLTANFTGNTGSNYTIVLTTGQVINGCTFTNGATAFTTPSTSITGTPFTTLTVTIQGVWVNITATGLTVTTNAGSTILGTYQLSTSSTGSPVVASGTIILGGNLGIQSPTYNGAANLVLAGNGTATLNGLSAPSWYTPTTATEGGGYYIYITPTGGTAGYSFSAANGVWTNITSGGLTIGISGPVGQNYFVAGTYIIASDPAGVNRLGTGSVTLTGGTDVQSNNYSGTTPLNLAGNGAATLNGVSAASWYSPNTANTGSGYWVNVTRTSGTAGVNFSAAQGSWTNITNSGLTIGMSGYTGDVGTITIAGTYQISSSSSGTPVLGSGTISLSVNAGTVVHVYTTAVVNATETIPTNTTNVSCEVWGSGGGGGCFHVATGGGNNAGGNGGAGGFSYSVYTAAALGGAGRTFKYTVTAGGAGGASIGVSGTAGTAGSVTAGTVTGFTAMTGNGGNGGTAATSGSFGSSGTGGTASGGNTTNTTGGTGSTTGTSGSITGDGSPYGGGGQGGSSAGGSHGTGGAAVFFYS